MKTPGFIKVHDEGDGYECSECGDAIEPGERAVKATQVRIEEEPDGFRRTGGLFVGIYHWGCFQ